MNFQLHQGILQPNMRACLCDLKLKRAWVRQLGNYFKTQEEINNKGSQTEEIQNFSPSPDLNPAETLQQDRKQAVQARHPLRSRSWKSFTKKDASHHLLTSVQDYSAARISSEFIDNLQLF